MVCDLARRGLRPPVVQADRNGIPLLPVPAPGTLAQITTPGQAQDSYLLALAVANLGKVATFKSRLATKAVCWGAGWGLFD